MLNKVLQVLSEAYRRSSVDHCSECGAEEHEGYMPNGERAGKIYSVKVNKEYRDLCEYCAKKLKGQK
jgi:hypothetical protein